MLPEVIYKDSDFLVINKPAGLLVHETSNIEYKTLTKWLLENYPEVKDVGDEPTIRPGIVHRLDRDTSGVMIIARTQKAFNYFKEQFQKRKIKKIYLALVYGVPKEKNGVINKPLGIKSDSVKRTAHIKTARMVKNAITKYKVISSKRSKLGSLGEQTLSLLEVQPFTGRTHQIRVHLASIGHPIVGDKLYGPKKLKAKRMFLHAESLEFTSPSGEKLKIATDPLENFQL